MPTQASNNVKYLLAQSDIDFGADVFKIILMKSGFAFNRATHNEYANVASDELTAGAGYTTGGQVLAGVAVTRDDTNNWTVVTWNNASWLATGGDIITQGAIIFDDTTVNDPIVGYIDFGEALTTFDSGNFSIVNIGVEIF